MNVSTPIPESPDPVADTPDPGNKALLPGILLIIDSKLIPVKVSAGLTMFERDPRINH